MGFHLSVINPNSDGRVTKHLEEVCSRVLPAGSLVTAVDCPGNPFVIETALDEINAGPSVVRAALDAGSPDGYFVACFGNPAVAALRELKDVPVVGLGEAALVEATLVTGRFGVVTTLERGIAALWDQLGGAGRAQRCVGIRSVEAAGCPKVLGAGYGRESERGTDDAEDSDIVERLVSQGRLLLDDGAEGIVLACAAFGPHTELIVSRLGVPVCDGIGFGASLVHGLFQSGVKTSKRGSFAWPASGAPGSKTDRQP